MWKPVAENATCLEWGMRHTCCQWSEWSQDPSRNAHATAATNMKRPRIPGNSGEIQGFPVFPALPLIDLQDSASKIPLLRALLLEDRSEGQTCDWCDWCGWCKSNKVSNLKRLNKYGQRTSQILWTSLNCDAIYPHSSSLPQVFAAISCACGRGCCGCYISAGRRCSARDPTDATNPITLGQVVMALYFLPERCGRAGRGH